LKDPELLILDEPANGLDPSAVAEMRELLRAMGSGGRTVLLSSHQLSEVEQSCDRVGVINAGRLVAERTVADVRTRLGSGGLVIVAAADGRGLACLRAHTAVQALEHCEGQQHVTTDPAHAADLNRSLVKADVVVRELRAVLHPLQ